MSIATCGTETQLSKRYPIRECGELQDAIVEAYSVADGWGEVAVVYRAMAWDGERTWEFFNVTTATGAREMRVPTEWIASMVEPEIAVAS